MAEFFDYVTHELGVEGITVSPGYAYERAPDQEHFLNREKDQDSCSATCFRLRKGKRWRFSQSSSLFLELPRRQSARYHCTPLGQPDAQYLRLAEAPAICSAKASPISFKGTDGRPRTGINYGTGNYEKCADCMAHCGYEPTAVNDAVKSPLKTFLTALRGPKTEGDMLPDISLANQRPAQDVYEKVVAEAAEREENGARSVYKSKAVA